jgi:ASCH domain-containing protein
MEKFLMLAVSVRQPWAWAIARGHKAVENRDWDTRFRGALAIHASLRVDLDSPESPAIRAAHWDPDDPAAAIGGIVAVVRLSGVCTAAMPGSVWWGSGPTPEPDAGPAPALGTGEACACGAWAKPGRYHWQLCDPRPLSQPVFAVSETDDRGLWELPPSVAAEVARLLAVPA